MEVDPTCNVTGSDHEPLTFLIFIHQNNPPNPEEDLGYRFESDNQTREAWTLEFHTKWLEVCNSYPNISVDNQPAAIDRWATLLGETILAATAATMKRKKVSRSKQSPWWSSNISEVIAEIQEAGKHGDIDRLPGLRNKLKRVIQEAKSSWATSIVESATNLNIWQLAGWSKGKRKKVVPPLEAPDGSII
ncbi:hypothetical protein H0H81_004676, partial [Sphagnurus paluster]